MKARRGLPKEVERRAPPVDEPDAAVFDVVGVVVSVLEVCAALFVEEGRTLIVGVVPGAVTEEPPEPEGARLALEMGPPGVPGAVDAAETEEALAELEAPSISFSAIEKGALVAKTLPILETSTNSRVKPGPASSRGRGIPTEPKDVWTLLATPMLGLNCWCTNSTVNAVGSPVVLVQVTTLVILPFQFAGVLMVSAATETAVATKAGSAVENMVDEWKRV